MPSYIFFSQAILVPLRLPQMLLEYNMGDYTSTATRIGRGIAGNRATTKAQYQSHSRWVRIYAGFIRGPHFPAWFERKTDKHVAEIKEASRNLRLDMSGEALIKQNVSTSSFE